MEEYLDPDKPESTKTGAQVCKKPVHLFLIRFLGAVMVLGALYNLYDKFGLGAMELLFMSRDQPPDFIYGVIVSGVLALFCGIGIILLSDTSRQAALVMAFAYILADIRLLAGDTALMFAGRPRLEFLSQNNAQVLLFILVAYQGAWIFFFTRDSVRRWFVFKEQKGYLLVGLVFLLVVYAGWYDFAAIYRKVSPARPPAPVQKKQPAVSQNKAAAQQSAKTGASLPQGPKVKGILASRGNFSVMIDNKFYSIGDTIRGWTIVDIQPEKISVQFPSGKKEFTIGACITDGKQEGRGGEPPAK